MPLSNASKYVTLYLSNQINKILWRNVVLGRLRIEGAFSTYPDHLNHFLLILSVCLTSCFYSN